MTLHEVIQADKCILLVNPKRILSRKNLELVADDDNHMKNSLMFIEQYFAFDSMCREEGENNFFDEMCIATCYEIRREILTLSSYLNGEKICVDDGSFKRGHFDLVRLCSWLREFVDE